MGSKQELTKKLNEIQTYVQNNPEQASNHLYSFFEKATELGSKLVNSKGTSGWSTNLQDSSGNSLFTPEEQQDVESHIKIPTELDKPGVQLGGSLLIPGGVNSLLKLDTITVDPRDISIDAAFFKLKNYLEEYDFKFKEIAAELGILDLIQEGPDLKGVIPMPPPIPPIPWYLSRRLAVPLASTFVEIMRVWIAIIPIDFTLYRFFLSLIQTFLDAIRGDLKQALLSSLGLFSQGGLRTGIVGRFLVNLLSFVSPDLQEEFAVNLFKTSKSFVVGITLWLFSVLSPDFIRITVDKSMDLAKQTVEEFNQKLQDVEKQVDTVAQKAGLEVSFPRIPEEFVPTLDDIQNIQMLARNPQVFCSPQFQAIIEPLKMIPPMRFVLDMLNIPTVQEDVEATCKGVDSSSMEAAVKEWATPNVKIIPGGPTNQALQAKKMLENPQEALGALAGKAGLPMDQLGDLKDMASNPTGALTSLAGQAGLPVNQLGKLGDLKDMASNPTGALTSLAGQAGLPVDQLQKIGSMASNPTGALTSLAGQAGLPVDQLQKIGSMASNPTGALTSLAGQAGLPVDQIKKAANVAKKFTRKGGKRSRKNRRNKTYRKR